MNENTYGDESEAENRDENQYEPEDEAEYENEDENQYEGEYEREPSDEGEDQNEYEKSAAGDGHIAKIYYADEEATQVDAAFVIEDWDWVVGFNQVATDEDDYVSIPVGKVIGVMSPKYTTFTQNGRRVTAYGVEDDEVEAFAHRLPV